MTKQEQKQGPQHILTVGGQTVLVTLPVGTRLMSSQGKGDGA